MTTALAHHGGTSLTPQQQRRQEEEAALAALKEAGIDVDDKQGKDNIDTSKVRPPFLAAAQKTSPQVEDDNPKQIPGLKFLELFDTNSGEIYGTGPVPFIPLAVKKHAIEFKPFKDGGGVVDRNVPLSDPRCKWNDDETDPEKRKPRATVFLDVIALVGDNLDLMVLSFKSTSLANGELMAMLMKKSKAPLYAQRWTLSTVKVSKSTNTFAVLVPKAAGIADPETAKYALSVLETVVPKVDVEHEQEADETSSSVVEAEVVPAASKGADDIPF